MADDPDDGHHERNISSLASLKANKRKGGDTEVLYSM